MPARRLASGSGSPEILVDRIARTQARMPGAQAGKGGRAGEPLDLGLNLNIARWLTFHKRSLLPATWYCDKKDYLNIRNRLRNCYGNSFAFVQEKL